MAAAVLVVLLMVLLAFGSDASQDKAVEVAAVDGTVAVAEHDPGTTPATPSAQAQPFSLVWVGDMMLGSTTPDPRLPGDPAATFDGVRDLLRADVVTGNLEGPITETGPKSKCDGRDDCYMFSQPLDYAAIYKDAGFGVVNLANNHSNDRGEPGRTSTMAHLDEAQIAYTGLPGQVHERVVNGTRVAFLGFSHYSTTNPITDLGKVGDQVRDAAGRNDVVVVFFHGGLEGDKGTRTRHSGDPGADFIKFAHTAVDAGADLVAGSGPHVLRAMEVYEGRLIAYSLGNFATYGWFSLTPTTSTSGVLSVELGPDGAFRSGKLSPTKLTGKGTPAKGGDAVDMVRRLSKSDFPDTGAVVSEDGAISAP